VKDRMRRVARRLFRHQFVRNIVRHPLTRRIELLERHSIDLVLDVGANAGQYADQLRDIGYQGRIVSFEPIKSVFKVLHRRTEADPDWEAFNMAIGEENRHLPINVAKNLFSSSLLEMLPRHLQAEKESEYVDVEEVDVRRFDAILDTICGPHDRVFLKIDTQGYEKFVLSGIGEAWSAISGIQVEVALVPLYKGEFTLTECIEFLDNRGYRLVGLEPGFFDNRAGELLQVDCFFFSDAR
jgi:FkbM family methyltransferase